MRKFIKLSDHFKTMLIVLTWLTFTASHCDSHKDDDDEKPTKEELLYKDFLDLIESEWELDTVLRCGSDVTSFYEGFTITFSESDSVNADYHMIDYSTTFGSPAFPAEGLIAISKTKSFNGDEVEARRSDNITMIFTNLTENFENRNAIDFDLVNSAPDCDAPGGRTKRPGNHAFKCQRR